MVEMFFFKGCFLRLCCLDCCGWCIDMFFWRRFLGNVIFWGCNFRGFSRNIVLLFCGNFRNYVVGWRFFRLFRWFFRFNWSLFDRWEVSL
jgi:hypothetical protein